MPRTVEQIQFTPHMPKALRVAAYARVSCGKDAMLHSLAAQVDHYSTYIRHHPGWEYVGVYADEAKTGTRDSRENFQRMLADCRAAGYEPIICSAYRTQEYQEMLYRNKILRLLAPRRKQQSRQRCQHRDEYSLFRLSLQEPHLCNKTQKLMMPRCSSSIFTPMRMRMMPPASSARDL